jgi:hypothetical protein
MKKPLKRGLLSALGLCLGSWCCISFSWAQGPTVIEFPSSPNPVGSGARALGMGGAFIAVADDATAATWNPGGLIQLETPEISAVFSGIQRTEDKSFTYNPEASGSDSVDDFNINYLSAVYPFTLLDHNMVVSLNYQHLYDFNRDWKFNFIYPPPTIYDGPHRVEYEQRGALYALGLAYCIQITRSLSVGVTLNYWGDFIFDNKWEQNYKTQSRFNIAGTPALYSNSKMEEYNFEGWNANLGFLFRINEHLTIGGVFKTPFKADIKHTVSEEERTEWPTLGQVDLLSRTASYDEELEMPMSYGIGLAIRIGPGAMGWTLVPEDTALLLQNIRRPAPATSITVLNTAATWKPVLNTAATWTAIKSGSHLRARPNWSIAATWNCIRPPLAMFPLNTVPMSLTAVLMIIMKSWIMD